jgi:hypothetical protein
MEEICKLGFMEQGTSVRLYQPVWQTSEPL